MPMEFFRAFRPGNRAAAIRDMLAGVSLASMDIPQLLGYARIAGMPAVAGLYTGLLPVLAFALFGASQELVVAADSATGTIFASKISTLAPPSSAEYVALAGMTALLTAVMLLVARVFRLGFLADFLSRTVLVGFLAGVGVQVGVAMLGEMLGLKVDSRLTTAQLGEICSQLALVHIPTLIISVMVVAVLLAAKRLVPRWPIPMLVVALAIAVSRAADAGRYGIGEVGPLEIGLPTLHLFRLNWSQVMDLLQVAASCVIVIIAQSAATSRAFAELRASRVDENGDLLGLAAANVAAALSGAFVVNGSPTQTAMAAEAGARSQLAQVTMAGVVLVVLLFLAPWLQYLPQCVLASIVFTIAVGLIAVRQLHRIRLESPGEFMLALTTAAAVVVAGVQNGIFIAIGLSLLRHVRHSYLPHTVVLAPNDDGQWTPHATQPGLQSAPGLIVYRFGADLFYANEHWFVDEVRSLVESAPSPVRCIVVDASAITDLDYSAAASVNRLFSELRARGIRVVFARVSIYLRADMDRHGVTGTVEAANVYSTLHEALASVQHPPAQA